MTETKHTPGPRRVISSDAECDAFLRLRTEATASYQRHCGPRAVECAEGDLLGEALQALHGVTVGMCRVVTRNHPEWLNEVYAVLAKATE